MVQTRTLRDACLHVALKRQGQMKAYEMDVLPSDGLPPVEIVLDNQDRTTMASFPIEERQGPAQSIRGFAAMDDCCENCGHPDSAHKRHPLNRRCLVCPDKPAITGTLKLSGRTITIPLQRDPFPGCNQTDPVDDMLDSFR